MATVQFLVHGALLKGHGGEVIIWFLSLWAIDKAMGQKKKWTLYHGRLFKVTLLNFLAQFSCEGAEVQLEQLLNKQPHEDRENVEAVLEKLGLWTDCVAEIYSDSSARDLTDEAISNKVMESKVCFTHVMHLSGDVDIEMGMIMHNLLRYAYRRSSAIVVEEGMRGIDLGDSALVW